MAKRPNKTGGQAQNRRGRSAPPPPPASSPSPEASATGASGPDDLGSGGPTPTGAGPEAYAPYSRAYDPATPPPRPGLDMLRAVYRTLGVTDPVEVEVMVLTNTPVGEFGAVADMLRADARFVLPAPATPEQVEAEAIRILHEMAGLVPLRRGPPQADNCDGAGPHGSQGLA